MVRLTRWVLRHRLLVVVAWLVLTVAGAVAVPSAIDAMTPDFGALPGRVGYETNQEIDRVYGAGGAGDPVVVLLALPEGTTVDTPGVSAEFARALDTAANAAGGARRISYMDTGDRGLVSADGRTTVALLYPPGRTEFPPYAPTLPRLTRALADVRVAGVPVQVTGTDALFLESSEVAGPGLLAETTIAGLAALIVLAAVFGSALALVPLLTAVMAILVTFLAVWGLTALTDVSFVVQFLVGLVGLGIAIDYALVITTRWREERTRGADNATAVERAMLTAGSSVVFSGVTVAIALASMVVLPVPFLRSMGYGGLLIPLVSVLIALTLLPVLLATIGPRLDRRRGAGPGRGARRARRPLWPAWARLVVRRPVLAAGVSGLLLAALVVPAFSIQLGSPAPASVSSAGPARQALDVLERSGIGSGVLSPIYVLVPDGAAAAVATATARVPGVRTAVAPPGENWRRDGTGLVVVLPAAHASSPAGEATYDSVRSSVAGFPGARPGGIAAQDRDFIDAVYGNAGWIASLLILITLALLIRAFRSLLLAVKAMALNVLSVGASFGLVVLAWQRGLLSEPIWGIDATGSLSAWVPVMVFAFLFGLSMDYEVFILARMREEYDATGSTADATVAGIARTGRLVTSAAVILFLAFVSLAATPGTEVKVFATALGLGILLDATVVRAVLVPALVVLMGRWNWWLPGPLGRLLRVSLPRPAPGSRREAQSQPA